MHQQIWVDENRKILVCVDSYEDGVPKGRFYYPGQNGSSFASLSQFLLQVEDALDRRNVPQAYAPPKSFALFFRTEGGGGPPPNPKGALATFELNVIFRQHTSWQGILHWRERKVEHSFRSVLELLLLLDSALTATRKAS